MNIRSQLTRLRNFITHPVFLLSTLATTMAWRSTGKTNADLVGNLWKNGLITTQRVKDAMLKVDRGQYCPDVTDAYIDSPQPIGWRATISAPHMHASALESLFPSVQSSVTGYPENRPMRVLDIGSGSGYLTHVMAELAGPGGKVVGIEHIQPLTDLGRENMSKSKEGRQLLADGTVRFATADGRKGYSDPEIGGDESAQSTWDEKGWDAIHVGAGAAEIHPELIQQLRRPGRMFIPVDDDLTGFGQHIWLVDKDKDGEVKKKKLYGVSYVPLQDPNKM